MLLLPPHRAKSSDPEANAQEIRDMQLVGHVILIPSAVLGGVLLGAFLGWAAGKWWLPEYRGICQFAGIAYGLAAGLYYGIKTIRQTLRSFKQTPSPRSPALPKHHPKRPPQD